VRGPCTLLDARMCVVNFTFMHGARIFDRLRLWLLEYMEMAYDVRVGRFIST